MNHTEDFQGIRLDVQAVDFTPDEAVHKGIRKMLSRLSRHYSDIEWADIYLQDKPNKSTHSKTVKVRLGIPGPDAVASDSGDNFMVLLSGVEEKLRRQLEKK